MANFSPDVSSNVVLSNTLSYHSFLNAASYLTNQYEPPPINGLCAAHIALVIKPLTD